MWSLEKIWHPEFHEDFVLPDGTLCNAMGCVKEVEEIVKSDERSCLVRCTVKVIREGMGMDKVVENLNKILLKRICQVAARFLVPSYNIYSAASTAEGIVKCYIVECHDNN